MLDKLSSGLKNAFDKVKTSLFVDDTVINELIKDLQKALLSSDVNVKLVFELTKNIKNRIKNEKTPPGLSKKDHLVKIVYDELVKFLGEEQRTLNLDKKPSFIMLVGLFGSGKTTTAGKLAKYYKTRGYKVATVQTDTWRPAAYEQLKTLSEQANVDFYGIKGEKDALKIFESFKDKYDNYDIVIVDTAGRDALSTELIDEIKLLKEKVNPSEVLLVINADIGQSAEKQAKTFHEAANITGIIITKLDGTAKAGGALTACAVSGAKVVFIGTGEKISDLESFDPEGFVGRLLGLGDLKGLLEKVEEAFKEEDVIDIQKKFMKGDFNLIDLYEQMKAMRKMGPLSKVLELIPGFSKLNLPKEALQSQEKNIEKWKYILDSMTKKELENPEIISSSRIERISKGSGTEYSDVKALLKQYKQSKKMIKMFKGQNPKKLQRMMGNIGNLGM